MKYLIIPKKNNELEKFQEKGADAFIFGLEKFSVNYPEITLEEIKDLSKKYPLWIALNKNIRNEELEELEKKLVELSELNIQGVLFYDLAILSIVQRKELKLPLVWHQTHMVTNYNTCNYYYSKGVENAFVSNEITLDEILEIKENTKIKLLVQLFGYPVMSHSRRNLITNYFKDIEEPKEKEIYELTEKSEEKFLIKESHAGTTILFGKIINGTKPLYSLLQSNIEYGVLDTNLISDEIALKVLGIYNEIRENYKDQIEEQKENIVQDMNKLIGDNTNFFYKKTIYKVKKGTTK